MKKDKIVYWTATGFLLAVFSFSATMYFLNYARVEGFFESLGFPTWLIYPLAIAKVLGMLAVLSKKSNFLKELAYAGFLFDAMLALAAHLIVGDGEFAPSVVAIIAVSVSWIYDRKVYGNYLQSLTHS